MATAETRASPATKATTTRATTRARAVAGTGTASRNPAADACASTKAGPARGPAFFVQGRAVAVRSEEHTSELQSLMRISYTVFCQKKKTTPLSTVLNNYLFLIYGASSIIPPIVVTVDT